MGDKFIETKRGHGSNYNSDQTFWVGIFAGVIPGDVLGVVEVGCVAFVGFVDIGGTGDVKGVAGCTDGDCATGIDGILLTSMFDGVESVMEAFKGSDDRLVGVGSLLSEISVATVVLSGPWVVVGGSNAIGVGTVGIGSAEIIGMVDELLSIGVAAWIDWFSLATSLSYNSCILAVDTRGSLRGAMMRLRVCGAVEGVLTGVTGIGKGLDPGCDGTTGGVTICAEGDGLVDGVGAIGSGECGSLSAACGGVG